MQNRRRQASAIRPRSHWSILCQHGGEARARARERLRNACLSDGVEETCTRISSFSEGSTNPQKASSNRVLAGAIAACTAAGKARAGQASDPASRFTARTIKYCIPPHMRSLSRISTDAKKLFVLPYYSYIRALEPKTKCDATKKPEGWMKFQ